MRCRTQFLNLSDCTVVQHKVPKIADPEISTMRLDPAAHGMGAPQGCHGVAMPMETIQATRTQLAPGLARQNTCISPQCSTDLTMTAVRPPKFLDGNEPTYPMSRASLNAGAVAGGTHVRSFPPRDPAFRRPSVRRTHWNPTTPSQPALRKCPCGAINI